MEYFQPKTSNNDDTETQQSIIPSALTLFFPADLVNLAEARRPAIVFGKQIQAYLTENVAWEQIQIETHSSIQQYRPPGNNDESTSPATLENLLFKALSKANFNFPETESKRIEIIALLVLLGWKARETTISTKETTLSLTCELCQSNSNVALAVSSSGNEASGEQEPPPPKRAKTSSGFNILSSHRHYCPYVCGFPRNGALRTTPLWKSLADKILTPATIAELPSKLDWSKVKALLKTRTAGRINAVDAE